MPAGAGLKRLRYPSSIQKGFSLGSPRVRNLSPTMIDCTDWLCSSRSSLPFRPCAIELISPCGGFVEQKPCRLSVNR